MSKLDDKLRDICEEMVVRDVGVEYTDGGVWVTDETITKIKEAFIEANWFDVTTPEFEESLLKSIALGDITFSINGTSVKLEKNHE